MVESRNRDKIIAAYTLKKILEEPKNRTLSNFSWIRLRYELFANGLRNETISESLKETLGEKRSHFK
jgi:hypothetical protein